MKIMTNSMYNTILDLITSQREQIKRKESEIKRMEAQIDTLQMALNLQRHMIETTKNDNSRVSIAGAEIQFPNSEERGFEDSNIFDL